MRSSQGCQPFQPSGCGCSSKLETLVPTPMVAGHVVQLSTQQVTDPVSNLATTRGSCAHLSEIDWTYGVLSTDKGFWAVLFLWLCVWSMKDAEVTLPEICAFVNLESYVFRVGKRHHWFRAVMWCFCSMLSSPLIILAKNQRYLM